MQITPKRGVHTPSSFVSSRIQKINLTSSSPKGFLTILMSCLCLLLGVMLFSGQLASSMNLAEQVEQVANQQQQQVGGDLQKQPITFAMIEQPAIVVRVLENLLRNILDSANLMDIQSTNQNAQKRGLDLGISRGFSGSQAGKHLMGLSAASFANGPGRR